MNKWQLNTVHISNLDEGRLDEVYQAIYGAHDFVESWLEKDFIAGVAFGISDLAAYAHFSQVLSSRDKISNKVGSWLKKCQAFLNSDSGDDKKRLFEFFEANGITYCNTDHPEVFTVEAMLPHLKDLEFF